MNKKIIYALVCFILFLILSILVILDKTAPFDNFIYQLVTFKMNDTITFINKIFTFFGSTFLIIVLSILLIGIFWFKKKKNCSFIVGTSIIISTIFNNIIKIIIRRDRPNNLPLVNETSFSFPSGHTMASTTLYGILLYIVLKSNLSKSKKITLSIILVIMPFLVALSRIYLGAHFATDIIGGFLLSLTLLFLGCSYIDKKKLL